MPPAIAGAELAAAWAVRPITYTTSHWQPNSNAAAKYGAASTVFKQACLRALRRELLVTRMQEKALSIRSRAEVPKKVLREAEALPTALQAELRQLHKMERQDMDKPRDDRQRDFLVDRLLLRHWR
ncbi:uncharacterized protein MYCFIDRAFT_205513 [Pseudocercospora fijiensis CIRAD86]|uniref:Uncharacterized protein n=1 Tax=Pseudocercospora fijiensis (strain CIRAD86) TaxID=383855 RepID=M2ZD98_PSEFD|nr:uncharacterized protein MYCFIDRAFT_205513 [Pseudocercospora fijiensis CIRAD86]EME77089.1 hypothetical protein MYCFIDRAFT_205513 [Pseudocercospora fijiensis CIRAD86]